MKEIIIENPENTNIRLDYYISNEVEGISRNYAKDLIKNQRILINNHKAKPSYLTKLGDKVSYDIPEPEKVDILPENIPIKIIYEDKDIIVINKDQGMVVHPAPGHSSGTLVNALMYHTENLSEINGKLRPGIVHRIDKDTAGLLIIAKNNVSHQKLSEDLKKHNINREYLAIVEGVVNEEKGKIDAPVGRDPRNRLRMAVTPVNSKNAVTHFKVIGRYHKYTYIRCALETGRTHQIRVHMKYIGHPIVGDQLYNNRKSNFKLNGQLLCAVHLDFNHPVTGEKMVFDIAPPEYFNEVIRKILLN
jgi:23S rRNA pseudouridine1911/1915/1917 synthase